MGRLFAVAIAFAMTTWSTLAVARPVVAVFEVQDDRREGRLTASRRRALTDYVTTMLGEGTKFRVVPRGELQRALQREKAASYRACYDEKCQIEIGKAVAAEKSLAVRVLALGGVCVVTGTLYDLKQEVTDVSAREKGGCEEKEIVASLERIAARVKGEPVKPRRKSEIRFGGGMTIPIVRIDPNKQVDLDGFDVEVEKMLERALDVQESSATTPRDKANAWCALAKKRKKNPHRKSAKKACQEWTRYIRDHRRAAAKITKAYKTLDGYLGLKRKTREQKLGVVEGFLAAFGAMDRPEVGEVQAARRALEPEGGTVLGWTDAKCMASLHCAKGFCSAVRFGCGAKTDRDCEVVCKTDGRCNVENGVCVARSAEACKNSDVCRSDAKCSLRGDSCVATAKDCASTSGCRDLGRCGVSEGVCVATEEGCRASQYCRSDGDCAPHGADCKPASDAHCKASDACSDDGRCSLGFSDGEPYCIWRPTKEADCKNPKLNQNCQDDGSCQIASDGRGQPICGPLTDKHCEGSSRCKTWGDCAAGKDSYGAAVCVAKSNELCKTSETCAESGACWVVDVDGVPNCRAKSATDCARAKSCEAHGCDFADGECTARSDPNEPCGTACEQYGRCERVDGTCRALTKAHCDASDECKTYGKCTPRGGECVIGTNADCARQFDCSFSGKCTARGGACVVGTSADCAKTDGCKDSGRCTARVGECVVASDADCEKSSACKTDGRCAAVDGECKLTKHEHCRQTTMCLEDGRCSLASDGYCRVLSDADCVRSEPCRTDGRCSLGSFGSCQHRNDADCAKSKVCRDDGKCTFVSSSCNHGSNADCARSEKCRTNGECTYNERYATDDYCTQGTDADCQRSFRCANKGACSYDEEAGLCTIQSADDCRRTTKCREDGDCELRVEFGFNKCGR